MTREVRSSGAPPKASVALLVSVISVVIVAAAGAIAPTTTVVTPLGCVDDNDTGPDSCAQSTNGLYGARSVAVSPDGKSVYAASANDDAIVRFNRNTTTGALTPAGCVDDNDSGADACSQTADGLNSAFSVAVSPDGKSVYAASAGDDAVVRFNRNTTTGALTPAGCVDDNDTGDDTCAQSANGLQFVISVAVSADGTSVYAIAFTDSAVVRFNRNTTTGALTPAGCVDDNDTGIDTCAQSTNGLTTPPRSPSARMGSRSMPHRAKTMWAATTRSSASIATRAPAPSPPRDAWTTTIRGRTRAHRARTGSTAPSRSQ